MSNEHVSNNRTDAQRKASKALYDAITAQVEELVKEDSGVAYTAAHLKELAEAYALVAHGKA